MSLANNLLITGIVLEKDTLGQWSVARVITNKGKFNIHLEINKELNLTLIQDFASHITFTVKPKIQEFVQAEQVVPDETR